MAQYIDRASAMSVCSSNRAYSTMQDISNLPCAKVVDRERYEQVCEDVYNDSEMWKDAPMSEIMDLIRLMVEIGDRCFGGAK